MNYFDQEKFSFYVEIYSHERISRVKTTACTLQPKVGSVSEFISMFFKLFFSDIFTHLEVKAELHTSAAPYLSKCGNLPIQEIFVIT